MRKFLSVLLSLAMLMSMLVVPVAADSEMTGSSGGASTAAACHLRAEVAGAYVVTEGETVIVTLRSEAMTVETFAGGLSFDSTFLTCVGISTGTGYDRMADGALMTQLSTTAEANTSGSVGVSFVRTAETAYDAQELLTVTFLPVEGAAGETYIGVYEDSDGADGFAGDGFGVMVYIESTDVPHEHVYDQMVPGADYLVSEATCEEPAVYYWSCSCGEAGTDTFTYGDALGHTLTVTPAKQPTATEPGNTTYWTCGRCGKYFSDATGTVEIEADSWVIPPMEVGDAFTVYLESSAGQVCPGQEFTVTAKVQNAEPFAGFSVSVTFDADRLELIPYDLDEDEYVDKSSGILKGLLVSRLDGNAVTAVYSHATDTKKTEGVLFDIRFRVKDNATDGMAAFQIETMPGTVWNNTSTDSAANVLYPTYQNTSVGVGHVYDAAWSMDADNHWFACGNCDQQKPGTLEAHDFSAVQDNGDGTHSSFCTVCGYVAESAEEHYCGGWQNDDGSHWKVCDDCGAVYESESHSLSCTDNGDGSHNEACDICGYVASTASHGSTAGWHKDEGGHWRVCDYCGAEYDRDTHMMDYADNGNGTHSLMCDVCGYVEETATHSSAKWHEGEGRHWKVCDDCGAEFAAAAHTLGYEDNTNNTHSLVCSVCGYVAATGAHTDTGSWISAEAVHWKECGDCKAVFAKAVHSFAYQANTDGTHSYMCGVCGYVKETAAHSSDAWQTDGTDHWKVCDDCGTEFARGAHKATGEHAATCVAAAVCDVCALRYGEADAENHVWGTGVVTPSTASVPGTILYTCERDKSHTKQEAAPAYDENSLRVEISSVERIYAGRTATVDVVLRNNPGVAGMGLHFVFDDTYLTLTGMEEVGEMTGWVLNPDEAMAVYSNPNDQYAEGTVLRLTFAVAENAPAGTIQVSVAYQYGDINNASGATLNCMQSAGYIKVVDWLAGDANGDYAVDTRDTVLVMRYLAKYTDAQPDLRAADVNGDGQVDTRDTVLLMRYLAKYPDAKLVYRKDA